MTTPIGNTTEIKSAVQKHEHDLPPAFKPPPDFKPRARSAVSPVAGPASRRPAAGGERAIVRQIMRTNAAQVELYQKIIEVQRMLRFFHSPHYVKVRNQMRAYVARLEERENAGQRTGGLDPGELTRLFGNL